MSSPPDTSTLHSKLQRDGFAFVTAETMRQLLSEPQHPRTQDFLRRVLHPL